MIVPPDRPLQTIVATDCGSTTTKAILIEKVGDEYRQTYRGEAPTTVEAPFEVRAIATRRWGGCRNRRIIGRVQRESQFRRD